MNLAELRRLVTNYSGRTDPDFLSNVDDFIRLGHRFVERQWFGREQHFMAWNYQAELPAGADVVYLPHEYRHSAELTLHAYLPGQPLTILQLVRVPIEALVTQAPWRLPDGTEVMAYGSAWGEPRVFAVFGRQAYIRPVPATPRWLLMSGGVWATPLTYDSDETVVAQAAPEAVLYAALREAWGFLGDPAQKATWEAEATRAIDAWMRDGVQEEMADRGLPLVMQVPS
jgi:hypothetical protein